ncbi:MAG: undecaprenyl diphosphate synthase family protein [Candidatus Woesearchaeota archaeon]
MLDVLNFLKKKDKPAEIRHLAISIKGVLKWSKKNDKPLDEAFLRRDMVILSLISMMVEKNIPILTIYVLPQKVIGVSGKYELGEKYQQDYETVNYLSNFFRKLVIDEIISKNKIKISVLGKWYGLPGMIVESIKSIIDKTKDYDHFFLNFCVNYNGQEEIIDAFNLIQKEIHDGNIDSELQPLNKNLIKENTYSSYFIPPDLIIETGIDHKFSGLLLWDSVNARIFFIDKLFPDVKKDDVEEIIDKMAKD